MRVLIAPDCFTGTLTAGQAAEAAQLMAAVAEGDEALAAQAHATNALQPSQVCVTPLQRHASKAEHGEDTRARSIRMSRPPTPDKGAAP